MNSNNITGAINPSDNKLIRQSIRLRQRRINNNNNNNNNNDNNHDNAAVKAMRHTTNIMETAQCIFVDPVSRMQCSSFTSESPYCAYHLDNAFGLGIATTRIATMDKKGNICRAKFNGLFAKKAFRRNEIIAPYIGKIITNPRIIKRGGDYMVTLRKNYSIDANHSTSCAARFLNTARTRHNIDYEHKTPLYNNAKLCKLGTRKQFPNIRATKSIKRGAEIYIPYGNQYKNITIIQR
jgi:hypothetical protein